MEKQQLEIVKHPMLVQQLQLMMKNASCKAMAEPIKQLTLEIPAGLIDETDASPLDAMKRELNEEGGYKAEYYWEKVSEFYTSVGFCDEKFIYSIVILCQKLSTNVLLMKMNFNSRMVQSS